MKHVDEHLQCHEMKEESGIQNGGRVCVEAFGTEGVSDQRLSFFSAASGLDTRKGHRREDIPARAEACLT